MTELEKMIESCKVFAENPKVGNIEFAVNYEVQFKYDSDFIYFEIFLSFDEERFYLDLFKSNTFIRRKLTATTAHEAAAEALELCRKEAQKLVELLSEPKEVEKKCEEILQDINDYLTSNFGDSLPIYDDYHHRAMIRLLTSYFKN